MRRIGTLHRNLIAASRNEPLAEGPRCFLAAVFALNARGPNLAFPFCHAYFVAPALSNHRDLLMSKAGLPVQCKAHELRANLSREHNINVGRAKETKCYRTTRQASKRRGTMSIWHTSTINNLGYIRNVHGTRLLSARTHLN